jgi:hypothetical protein
MLLGPGNIFYEFIKSDDIDWDILEPINDKIHLYNYKVVFHDSETEMDVYINDTIIELDMNESTNQILYGLPFDD